MNTADVLNNRASQTRDESEQKLVRSLDRLILITVKNAEAINKLEKSYVNGLKQYIKSTNIFATLKKLSTGTGLARAILKPSTGGLLDRIITRAEGKREEKQNKNAFIQNYVENTEKGKRAFKKDPKAAKQLAGKLYDTNKSLDESISRQQSVVDAKNEKKERFGYGGASTKDMEQLDKLKMSKDRYVEKTSDKSVASLKANEKKDQQKPLTTEEEQQESIKVSQEMLETQNAILEVLKDIEANTNKGSESDTTKKKPKGGFLETISDALSLALSPALIWAALKRFALPVLIATSLINGIMDGFEEYKKTGSIKDAIIAGLGGILKVLTFGLFDVEDVKVAVKKISEAFTTMKNFFIEYVITPINEYVVKPLTTFFKSIYKDITEMLAKISIPKIEFTIPVINKKVSIGPFKPFANEEIKTNQKPTSEAVESKATEVTKMKEDKVAGKDASSNTVVSAPTTNMNSTNNSINFSNRPRTELPVYRTRMV